MKIAFVEPRHRETVIARNPAMIRFIEARRRYLPKWNNPSLSLLTIAGMVPEGWDVRYVHRFEDEIDYSERYDLVATGGMSCQTEEVYRICDGFRRRGVYTVAGGIHVSALPEEAARHADTVIVGEAEKTFPAFLEDFARGEPLPVYRQEGTVVLAESPVPRFDLLREEYQNYPLQTTRGCPHDCSFCSVTRIYGHRYRHKNVDQVLEEIDLLLSVRKNPFIIFSDDNMFVNRSFSRSLLERLVPLKLSWHAQTDVSVARDSDFLRLLRAAGCRELFIGFESLNPETLAEVNRTKEKMSKEYEQAIRRIQEHGIRVYGAFVLGFDGDTPGEVENLKSFVRRNAILGQFTALTPLPGTALYERYHREGRLLEGKTWRHYNFLDCVINHPHFTPDELEAALLELWETMYSPDNWTRVMRTLVEYEKKLLASGPS